MPNVLAIPGIVDVLLRQRLAKIFCGKLVLLRDTQDRALDHRIVDFNAVFLGELKQRTLGHHALEYLLVENVLRRRLHVLLLELLQHDTFGVVEIVLGDGLVVDHGDHPVHVDDTLWRCNRLRQRTGGCQRKS